ncbi:hypothetical protein ITI46_07805 [Streptomyces oryzae]|uniref:Uncharacterized protein n=1 Tax=Streptomyces oryzae TaxID=1434886 RepID=A0ABS3X8A9_9ACTN|nr:hypothetical protein [Streptomyces oryzae]MBO8191596.1 hypothetical protein [Streptomyces oryzae]
MGDGQVLVDRVPPGWVLWWLGGAGYVRLYEAPLAPLLSRWSLVGHRAVELKESARWVTVWHLQPGPGRDR